MELPERWQVACKYCAATQPKKIDLNSITYGWILAIPKDISGNDAVLKCRYWCSKECQLADPEHSPESKIPLLDRISTDIFKEKRLSAYLHYPSSQIIFFKNGGR